MATCGGPIEEGCMSLTRPTASSDQAQNYRSMGKHELMRVVELCTYGVVRPDPPPTQISDPSSPHPPNFTHATHHPHR